MTTVGVEGLKPTSTTWAGGGKEEALTVNKDGDSLLIIAPLRLHLSTARVLPVVCLRDIAYPQTVRVHRKPSA